jgi:hypothetical protein
VLEVAQPQSVRGAGGRQGLVAVGLEVIAEQLERGLVVLADDDRCDLVNLREHAP